MYLSSSGRSRVKFDAHYNKTTVDPPELVRFIQDNYPDVSIDSAQKKHGS